MCLTPYPLQGCGMCQDCSSLLVAVLIKGEDQLQFSDLQQEGEKAALSTRTYCRIPITSKRPKLFNNPPENKDSIYTIAPIQLITYFYASFVRLCLAQSFTTGIPQTGTVCTCTSNLFKICVLSGPSWSCSTHYPKIILSM